MQINNQHQWNVAVKACCEGDNIVLAQALQHLPSQSRFNKLIRHASSKRKWSIVEQLLPLWNPNKAPYIFDFARTTPLVVFKKSLDVYTQHQFNPNQLRKSLVDCFWHVAVSGQLDKMPFLIPVLRDHGITKLDNQKFWNTLGQYDRIAVYEFLLQHWNITTNDNTQMFLSACLHQKWDTAQYFSSTMVDPQQFIAGLINTIENGTTQLIRHFLPTLQTNEIQKIARKTLENSFAVDRKKPLSVWLDVLPSLGVLGSVVTDALRCAISQNNLQAVERLVEHYTPDEHNPLKWIVNNLAGSFEPDLSFDILERVLPRFIKSHPAITEAVDVATSRRGCVAFKHLDALRAYSSCPDIDSKALTFSVMRVNTFVIEHIMSTIDDTQFMKSINELKDKAGCLENLNRWSVLEPFIQPRLLNIQINPMISSSVSGRRKM